MKDKRLIKDRTEVILEELQTVISVLYILRAAIGLPFGYQKHTLFGINILDYTLHIIPTTSLVKAIHLKFDPFITHENK